MPGGTPNFGKAKRAYIEAAAPQSFDVDDLNDGQILDSNRFVEVAALQSDRSTKYAPGYGFRNRQYAEGWADLDMKSTPDGGTTINDPAGNFRWEYYSDSDKEALEYTSGTFKASGLRSAVTADLTNKPVVSQKAPAVNEDGFLVLAFKAKQTYDGETINAANSAVDQGIPYAKLKL